MQKWPRIWKVWAVSASVNPSSDVATAASGQTMSSTSKGKLSFVQKWLAFNTSFLTDLWFESGIDTSLRFLPIQEQEKWIIRVYWPMPSLMLPASCALPGMQSASVVAVERTSFNPHLLANTCSLYPKCSCTLIIWTLHACLDNVIILDSQNQPPNQQRCEEICSGESRQGHGGRQVAWSMPWTLLWSKKTNVLRINNLWNHGPPRRVSKTEDSQTSLFTCLAVTLSLCLIT